MKFRTQYDPSLSIDPKEGLYCPPEEGMTCSEFADDCDINKIMARYEKTGQLPQFRDAAAMYGDFSQIPDFQTMRNKVIAAEELFMALPAKVRARFDNDPGTFIEAAQTPEGVALLVELGLGKELPVASPAAPEPAAGQAAPVSQNSVEPANEPQQPSKKGK